jgi:hypothetical protein
LTLVLPSFWNFEEVQNINEYFQDIQYQKFKIFKWLAGNLNVYNRNTFSKSLTNVTTVKKYGDRYKLTTFKFNLTRRGFESDNEHLTQKQMNDLLPEKEKVDLKKCAKLENNIIRAKSKITEYALCNEFRYFCTFTIDKKKYDRNNLELFYKDFGKFINNYKNKIDYILIPELHKDDKSWHMHGLFNGIDKKDLISFDTMKLNGEKVPRRLLKKGYYNFKKYQKKFGFCSFGVVDDKEKVSSYITKYISKSLDKNIIGYAKHSFYSSNNLKKAIQIKKGVLHQDTDLEYQFENKYIKIKWFNKDNKIFNYIDETTTINN